MTTEKINVADLKEVRLRKRLKRVFQPANPEKLEVVIMEIWDIKQGQSWDVKYVVSLGGNKSITIHSEDDWEVFTGLVDEIDFLAATTQEIPVVKKEKGE